MGKGSSERLQRHHLFVDRSEEPLRVSQLDSEAAWLEEGVEDMTGHNKSHKPCQFSIAQCRKMTALLDNEVMQMAFSIDHGQVWGLSQAIVLDTRRSTAETMILASCRTTPTSDPRHTRMSRPPRG
jgi:hypothetical protein